MSVAMNSDFANALAVEHVRQCIGYARAHLAKRSFVYTGYWIGRVFSMIDEVRGADVRKSLRAEAATVEQAAIVAQSAALNPKLKTKKRKP